MHTVQPRMKAFTGIGAFGQVALQVYPDQSTTMSIPEFIRMSPTEHQCHGSPYGPESRGAGQVTMSALISLGI